MERGNWPSKPFYLSSLVLNGTVVLERIIKTTNSFLDVNKWRSRLGEIETQVCRIEIQSNRGTIYGTGFLLGPDVVITNYHVMEVVIESENGHTTVGGIKALSGDVILRFDYKRLADGSSLNTGTIYHLTAKNWLIDHSPMSPVDSIPEPKNKVPHPDQLDYALLRVEGSPGTGPVGGMSEPGSPSRKWIEVSTQSYDFRPKAPLFIVQHPQGDPLQLALDTEAVVGVNANCTRVTYRTNTLPGPSGSPCFNSNWELVALHHSGEGV
jgi:Trypsin-like peptidase domain